MSEPSADMPQVERILVVDDDHLVRRTVVSMLEASGYAVIAHEDGTQATELVAAGGIDLVILDVMMPRLSGLAVCRRIKATEQGRLVPVVLLTALGATEDVVAGLDAGADEFLTKPIDPAVLEARVRALLRFRRAHAAARTSMPARTLPELLSERVAALADEAGLSPREREVLDLLLLGRSSDEIGTALGITPRTAKFHQANVLEKVGADSRLDLLRLML